MEKIQFSVRSRNMLNIVSDWIMYTTFVKNVHNIDINPDEYFLFLITWWMSDKNWKTELESKYQWVLEGGEKRIIQQIIMISRRKYPTLYEEIKEYKY